LFERLGVTPVVNARGIYTDLGGSRLSPRVWAAMEEANRTFVDMPELLAKSGDHIARLIGAEAAIVTPGVSAGLVLAAAACMTRDNPDKLDQLPDTDGLPSRILIQHNHCYKWDRMVRLSGAKFVQVGDTSGTTAEAIEAAIDTSVAAIFFPAYLDSEAGTVPLAEVAEIARRHAVPVILDAAFHNFPTPRFGEMLAAGGDLTLFSAKYFGGPNAGGIVAGRRDLIDGVAAHDFTRVGTREIVSLGRGFKLDRQLVAGVVAALEEWLEMDHEARFEGYERHVQTLCRVLGDVPNIELTPMFFTMEETLEPQPINCLHIRVGADAGTTAERVVERLDQGNPAVVTHLRGDALVVDFEVVDDDDVSLIGRRLREELLAGE
jgi:L-seryl-tRNA(Ser) seleniumtransferase